MGVLVDKPPVDTIKFPYAICECKAPIEQLQTKKSIKNRCKCEIIKQLKLKMTTYYKQSYEDYPALTAVIYKVEPIVVNGEDKYKMTKLKRAENSKGYSETTDIFNLDRDSHTLKIFKDGTIEENDIKNLNWPPCKAHPKNVQSFTGDKDDYACLTAAKLPIPLDWIETTSDKKSRKTKSKRRPKKKRSQKKRKMSKKRGKK
jgi:hypothetical protein